MRGGCRLPVGGAATITRGAFPTPPGARRERKTSGPPSAALCDKTVRGARRDTGFCIPRPLRDFRERNEDLPKSVLTFPDFPNESLVRSHKGEFGCFGHRQVHRIIGGMVQFDGDRYCDGEMPSSGHNAEVGLLQGLGRDLGFLLGHLAAPHLLPENVGAFGVDQVGCYQPVVEQNLGAPAIRLGDNPFDSHASVDDEPLARLQRHRSSRPSRSSTSEGV
jgi:hypothetical protein